MRVKSVGTASELMVRRLAGSQVEDLGDWIVVSTPSNPGFWWGNFLVLPSPVAPGSAETWRQRFGEAFPSAGHLALSIDDPGGSAGDARELAALGVEVEVSAVLTTSPEAVGAQTAASGRSGAFAGETGAEVRRLGEDADWARLLALRRAADTQAVADEDVEAHRDFMVARVDEVRGLAERGHAAWFGAFEGGRLSAALGIVSDGAGSARYQDVETHLAKRRRGIARALVHRSAEYAGEEMRASSLVIVADPEYHAIDLYRSAGFRESGHLVHLQAGGY